MSKITGQERIDEYVRQGGKPEILKDKRIEAGPGPDTVYEALIPILLNEGADVVFFQRQVVRVDGRNTFLPAHDYPTPTRWSR